MLLTTSLAYYFRSEESVVGVSDGKGMTSMFLLIPGRYKMAFLA